MGVEDFWKEIMRISGNWLNRIPGYSLSRAVVMSEQPSPIKDKIHLKLSRMKRLVQLGHSRSRISKRLETKLDGSSFIELSRSENSPIWQILRREKWSQWIISCNWERSWDFESTVKIWFVNPGIRRRICKTELTKEEGQNAHRTRASLQERGRSILMSIEKKLRSAASTSWRFDPLSREIRRRVWQIFLWVSAGKTCFWSAAINRGTVKWSMRFRGFWWAETI